MTKNSAIRPIIDYFQILQDRGYIEVKDVAEAASLFLVVSAGAMRSFLVPVELDENGRGHWRGMPCSSSLYGQLVDKGKHAKCSRIIEHFYGAIVSPDADPSRFDPRPSRINAADGQPKPGYRHRQ